MDYTQTNPHFYGRKEVLDLLYRRVADLKDGYRQNVALIGNRSVGKTSIIHHFMTRLEEAKLSPLYIDLEKNDFHCFINKFIGNLLYNYSQKHGLPLYEEISFLIESTRKLLPNTTQLINTVLSDYRSQKWHEAFVGVLTLLEVYTNETNEYCVLMLDEFQNLEKFPVSYVFQILGKKIMTQKKCLYIVSSSYAELAQRILSEKLSLLFGNFEVVNVEFFDFSSSQSFIEQCLKETVIGVQLRNFLTDFTGGHPLYLNLICKELINLSARHRQAEIYMPLLSQAIENTIFDRWGVINRHFELIIQEICQGPPSNLLCQVLLAVCNGRNKIEEIIRETNIKRPLVMQKLNRLMLWGLIEKNGSVYYFKDKLFKYWMRYVYQPRLKDVDLSIEKLEKKFREEFNKNVDSFKLVSRKDFSSRIVELLQCFANESFLLNGRKYRLPTFQNVDLCKIKNDNGTSFDMLKASTHSSTWYIVLKKDNFGENDVSTIVKESKKEFIRPERCLLISLSDIDENTRLRALQERFWIWHDKELNTLLNLFDQPYIVK